MKGTVIRSTLTLRALALKSDLQGLRLAAFSHQGRPFGSAAAEAVFNDIPEAVKENNVSPPPPSSPPPPRPLPSSLEFETGFKVDLKAMDKQETVGPDFWQRQNKAKWWHPDPVSGVWVPEDKFGSVDTAQLRKQRLRNWPRASMDERAWWSSLEELPDEYDRPTKSRK